MLDAKKRAPGYLCFTRFAAFHLEVRHGRHSFRRFFIFFPCYLTPEEKIVNKAKYIFSCLACSCCTSIARNLVSEELLCQVFI